jgi:hypothetical protein
VVFHDRVWAVDVVFKQHSLTENFMIQGLPSPGKEVGPKRSLIQSLWTFEKSLKTGRSGLASTHCADPAVADEANQFQTHFILLGTFFLQKP